jgi:hypothetical protein
MGSGGEDIVTAQDTKDGGERTYYMNFDTESVPGKLVATRVRIARVVIHDMEKPLDLGLASDPQINDLIECIGSNTK